MGIKTVFKTVYPPETADLTPIVAKYAADKPDLVFAGTQSDDAYSEVKALVQAHYNPKFLFMSNGANSPVDFPDKVGAANTAGIMSCSGWFPDSKAHGNAAFVAAYLKKFGGTPDQIDETSAEAYATGQVIEDEAKQTGKIDNKTIIAALHKGTLADAGRQPELGRQRVADRIRRAVGVGERQAGAGLPAPPGQARPGHAEAELGGLIPPRDGRSIRYTCSSKRASSGC